jgi:hypothetical protein
MFLKKLKEKIIGFVICLFYVQNVQVIKLKKK